MEAHVAIGKVDVLVSTIFESMERALGLLRDSNTAATPLKPTKMAKLRVHTRGVGAQEGILSPEDGVHAAILSVKRSVELFEMYLRTCVPRVPGFPCPPHAAGRLCPCPLPFL